MALERRIVRAEIQKKRLTGLIVVGFGPGRVRIYTERGADKVITHGGLTTETPRAGVTVIKTIMNRLWIRVEVLPETGAKIIHISGG